MKPEEQHRLEMMSDEELVAEFAEVATLQSDREILTCNSSTTKTATGRGVDTRGSKQCKATTTNAAG